MKTSNFYINFFVLVLFEYSSDVMGKNNELKRAAVQHSQNLRDMFKKKKLEDEDEISTTTEIEEPSVQEHTENVDDPSDSANSHGKQSSSRSLPTEVQKPFQLNETFSFLIRMTAGRKSKRFNCDWFNNENWNSWLHYDIEKDAAFCATCITATRKNLITNKNNDKAFISNGYVNWSDQRVTMKPTRD